MLKKCEPKAKYVGDNVKGFIRIVDCSGEARNRILFFFGVLGLT